MPRTSRNTKQTEFYRLLVEQFYDGRWNEVQMYGPFTTAGACRGSRSGPENRYSQRYEDGVRRSRVQKQEVNWNRADYYEKPNNLFAVIEWVDVA